MRKTRRVPVLRSGLALKANPYTASPSKLSCVLKDVSRDEALLIDESSEKLENDSKRICLSSPSASWNSSLSSDISLDNNHLVGHTPANFSEFTPISSSDSLISESHSFPASLPPTLSNIDPIIQNNDIRQDNHIFTSHNASESTKMDNFSFSNSNSSNSTSSPSFPTPLLSDNNFNSSSNIQTNNEPSKELSSKNSFEIPSNPFRPKRPFSDMTTHGIDDIQDEYSSINKEIVENQVQINKQTIFSKPTFNSSHQSSSSPFSIPSSSSPPHDSMVTFKTPQKPPRIDFDDFLQPTQESNSKKIPGPAGKLTPLKHTEDMFKELSELKELENEQFCDSRNDFSKSAPKSPNPNSKGQSNMVMIGSDDSKRLEDQADFRQTAWAKMLIENCLPPFSDEGHLLDTSLMWVHQEGYKSKVPSLIVLVKSLKTIEEDCRALLRDPTFESDYHTVSRKVIEKYPEFTIGCVVELKNVSVLTPKRNCHYLIISVENIVKIWPKSSDMSKRELTIMSARYYDYKSIYTRNAVKLKKKTPIIFKEPSNKQNIQKTKQNNTVNNVNNQKQNNNNQINQRSQQAQKNQQNWNAANSMPPPTTTVNNQISTSITNRNNVQSRLQVREDDKRQETNSKTNSNFNEQNKPNNSLLDNTDINTNMAIGSTPAQQTATPAVAKSGRWIPSKTPSSTSSIGSNNSMNHNTIQGSINGVRRTIILNQPLNASVQQAQNSNQLFPSAISHATNSLNGTISNFHRREQEP